MLKHVTSRLHGLQLRTGNCDKPQCAFAHDERLQTQSRVQSFFFLQSMQTTSGSFVRRRASLRPSCVVLQTVVVASMCLSFVSGARWNRWSVQFRASFFTVKARIRMSVCSQHTGRPRQRIGHSVMICPSQELLPEEKPAGPQSQASMLALASRTGRLLARRTARTCLQCLSG